MRILIETVHPAQVLFFLPIRERLIEDGHAVRLLTRKKDVALDLLEGVPHQVLSEERPGILGRGREAWERHFRFLAQVREFQPDVILAKEGASACFAGWWANVPVVAIDDTDDAWLQRLFSLPFATRVLTDGAYPHRYGEKHRTYHGISPLAYLTPQKVRPSRPRPRVALRLVAWDATHDWGKFGIGDTILNALLEDLVSWCDPIISSERGLPERWSSLAYGGRAQDWSTMVAECDLVVSESATVAAEAVVLGVPPLYFSPRQLWYTKRLEEWGLLRCVSSLEETLAAAEKWTTDAAFRAHWGELQQRYFRSTDDIPHQVLSALHPLPGSSEKKRFSSYTIQIDKPVL